jgi:hypothetical protein
MFGAYKGEGGSSDMTENERELLNIIRGYHNLEDAIAIAIQLMVIFSTKREVPQDTSSVHHLESV